MRPRIDAGQLLRGLIGEVVETVTGKSNHINGVSGDFVYVGIDKSPNGVKTRTSDLQKALDILQLSGSLPVNPETVGFRSSFIFAVLRTLPGVQTSARPKRVWYPDS